MRPTLPPNFGLQGWTRPGDVLAHQIDDATRPSGAVVNPGGERPPVATLARRRARGGAAPVGAAAGEVVGAGIVHGVDGGGDRQPCLLSRLAFDRPVLG